jgi:hypothetical protein
VLQPRRLARQVARIDRRAVEANQATDTTHAWPPPATAAGADDQRENRCGVNGGDDAATSQGSERR